MVHSAVFVSAVPSTISETNDDTMTDTIPPPIFHTISTNQSLEEGVYAVRDIGGGKYELISLNASADILGSEEIGKNIMAVPGRQDLLESLGENMQALAYKLVQANSSASKLLPKHYGSHV
jgi:hypothetical protein